MSARKSITGKTFERLFVRSDEAFRRLPSGQLQRMCDCICSCGKPALVGYGLLVSGHTTSCGCFISEKLKEGLHFKHGHAPAGAPSRTYKAWIRAMRRCVKHPVYLRYGTRMCEGWRNSFESFLADNGECPAGLEIDRWPDKLGHYSCGHCDECRQKGWAFNCRWATRKQQMQNYRNNHNLTVRGIYGCLAELCRHFNVPQPRTLMRLRSGWDVESAFFAAKRINQFG